MKTNKTPMIKLNSEEYIYLDKFRNKVTLTKLNDGSFKKVTQTNRSTDFEFLGDTYSYSMLDCSKMIKEYWENSHSERYLVQDRYNRLFHYRYDEEMNFDGGADREDILWTFVENEADSDQLTHAGNLSLLREPFVAADETDWVSAHEYVDSQFVEGLKTSKWSGIKSTILSIKTCFSRRY